MNRIITENQPERRRELYAPDTRVELVCMNDPHSSLKPGDRGTVTDVDDIGTVFVKWDNGSGLGVAYGEDQIKIVPSLSPKAVEGLLAVRATARTNMLDLNAVQIIANELQYFDTVIAIEENRKLVANFIFTGETEVNDNAKIK